MHSSINTSNDINRKVALTLWDQQAAHSGFYMMLQMNLKLLDGALCVTKNTPKLKSILSKKSDFNKSNLDGMKELMLNQCRRRWADNKLPFGS